MAASDHLQPQQLAMFMTPREILKDYSPGDASAYGSEGAMWARTRARADEEDDVPHGSLTNNIRANGVTEPIELTHSPRTMADGHHRMSVARDVAPDRLVPVIHHETYDDFQNDEGNWHGRYVGRGYDA
jgi:hypothetical protein